jgi:hypothetical protein
MGERRMNTQHGYLALLRQSVVSHLLRYVEDLYLNNVNGKMIVIGITSRTLILIFALLAGTVSEAADDRAAQILASTGVKGGLVGHLGAKQ